MPPVQGAGTPPNPRLVLALLLGTLGKRVNVPSMLLLLTPPGDVGALETLRSAGHTGRSPSSEPA